MSLQPKDLTEEERDYFNERVAVMMDSGCKRFFAEAYALSRIEERRIG